MDLPLAALPIPYCTLYLVLHLGYNRPSKTPKFCCSQGVTSKQQSNPALEGSSLQLSAVHYSLIAWPAQHTQTANK